MVVTVDDAGMSEFLLYFALICYAIAWAAWPDKPRKPQPPAQDPMARWWRATRKYLREP